MGRILVVEFKNQESSVFDAVMDVLKHHPNFEILQSGDETMVSIPGLEIYPDRRKIYHDRQEIDLTTKEYNFLYLLVMNRGHVLTYAQIYQNVWGEEALGNENNAVKCHIRNLRDKLYTDLLPATLLRTCVDRIGDTPLVLGELLKYGIIPAVFIIACGSVGYLWFKHSDNF